VLVTTWDGSPASWGPWCTRQRPGVLPTADAAVMLADHGGRHPGLGSDEDALRLLAGRLGGLLLAVKTAPTGSPNRTLPSVPRSDLRQGHRRTS
jgi:hypothetical protein